MIKVFFRSTVSRVSPEAPVPVVLTDHRPYRVTFHTDEIDDQAAEVIRNFGFKVPKTVTVKSGTPTTVAQLFVARGWPVLHVETQFPVTATTTSDTRCT
jgi:hypothetical protein